MGSSRYRRYGSSSGSYGNPEFLEKHRESVRERKQRRNRELTEWSSNRLVQLETILTANPGGDLKSLFNKGGSDTVTLSKLRSLQSAINNRANELHSQWSATTSPLKQADIGKQIKVLWSIQRTFNKDWNVGGSDKNINSTLAKMSKKYYSNPKKYSDLVAFRERKGK